MPQRAALTWESPAAAWGAACALPAAVVTLNGRPHGLALAVGVLPAAIVGVLPTRRRRPAVEVLGACVRAPIFLGGVLAGVPVLAVAAIAGLGVGSARLAARFRFGPLAMTLSLPMAGVGLSYSDVGTAAALAGLVVLGSLYACAISMLWPERRAPARRVARPRAVAPMLDYGVRFGAPPPRSASPSTSTTFGWACAAALLVMRPAAEMQRLRSVGRILSVTIGALVVLALAHSGPPPAVYSLAVLGALAGAAGARGSRWYVMSAFTTFLVFLLYSHPQDAASRFGERVLETLLGVSLGYSSVLPFRRLPRHAGNNATAGWTRPRRGCMIRAGSFAWLPQARVI